MRFPFQNRFREVLIVLLTVVIAGISAFQYVENQAIRSRLATLEERAQRMVAALQQSQAVSTSTVENIIQQAKSAAPAAAPVVRSQNDMLTAVVAKAAPAVVSIAISKDVALLEVQYVNPFGNDPYFRDVDMRVPVFRQVGTERRQVGAGTGFIARSDGYVITNRHVVNDEKADYTVLLSSGEKKTARVTYRDPDIDFAVLKIDGTGYTTIPLGDSSKIKLGQTVTAIGNALGEYSNTVAVGIISGLDRTIEASDAQGRVETLSGVIQTDAAINRGNSGGPLLDLDGRAIGVNVAVDQSGNNIGFALPINSVKAIFNRAI